MFLLAGKFIEEKVEKVKNSPVSLSFSLYLHFFIYSGQYDLKWDITCRTGTHGNPGIDTRRLYVYFK